MARRQTPMEVSGTVWWVDDAVSHWVFETQAIMPFGAPLLLVEKSDVLIEYTRIRLY